MGLCLLFSFLDGHSDPIIVRLRQVVKPGRDLAGGLLECLYFLEKF